MTLKVGTEDGLHNLDVSDGPARVELAGHSVDCLTRDDAGWWAVVDGEALWRSGGTGGWEQVTASPGPRLNCVWPSTAGLLAGAEKATLFRLEDGELQPVAAFDQVPGRDEWYTPWGGPPDVRSVSEDPGRAILVNVHVGGVVRSTDGGKSFRPTIDMHTDVHQVFAPPGHPGLVLAATGAAGLAVSSDDGDSWQLINEGLHASYSRAVGVGATSIFASASTGPRGGRAAVYRRPLDGGPFVRCMAGLPEWFAANIDTFCLAARGRLAAFGTDDGSLFLSEDEGESWRILADGLPTVRCVEFD